MKKIYPNLILVLGSILISTTYIKAQAPTNFNEIPLYLGVKLISEESIEKVDNITGGIRRRYVVSEATEKVVAFYEKALNTKKRFEDPDDQFLLKVGKTTQPPIEVYDWDVSRLVDIDDAVGGSARKAWIKNELLKREKDNINNAWIDKANSEWYYRTNKNTLTSIHVIINDISVDEQNHKYELKTEIIIEVSNLVYSDLN
jgi:hypothetical protein